MACDKCQYFKILYEPQKIGGQTWDFGRVRCEKHDLIADFLDRRKFKRLECPDNAESEGRNGRFNKSPRCD